MLKLESTPEYLYGKVTFLPADVAVQHGNSVASQIGNQLSRQLSQPYPK